MKLEASRSAVPRMHRPDLDRDRRRAGAPASRTSSTPTRDCRSTRGHDARALDEDARRGAPAPPGQSRASDTSTSRGLCRFAHQPRPRRRRERAGVERRRLAALEWPDRPRPENREQRHRSHDPERRGRRGVRAIGPCSRASPCGASPARRLAAPAARRRRALDEALGGAPVGDQHVDPAGRAARRESPRASAARRRCRRRGRRA